MRSCPFLKGKSGIYMLFNSVNNKIYIGQTTCMYKRCHQYIYDFRERKIGHLNQYLSRAMVKVGIDKFDFVPLEFTDELIKREMFWIVSLGTTDRNRGYNLRIDDPHAGLVTSPETSKKMSDNLKRQWAEGLRDGHSGKLKKIWAEDSERRAAQGLAFSKIKTKYEYHIYEGKSFTVVDYGELVERELKSVLSSFHRKKSNDVMIKGIRIVRVPLGE